MSAAQNALVIAGLGQSVIATFAVLATDAPARVLVQAPANDNADRYWNARFPATRRRGAVQPSRGV
jgi:hypothetical protein